MRIVATVAFLLLCVSATVAVSENSSTDTLLTATPGDIVKLSCYTSGNVTPSSTTWTQNGREVTVAPGNPPPAGQRFSVLHDGTLNIAGVEPGDEGTYRCTATLPGNSSFQAAVQLQVTRGPDKVIMSTGGPVTALPNGTLFTTRGSSVSFNCSSSSYPSQELTWAFSRGSFTNDSLASNAGPSLAFTIDDVQPGDQGNYSCRAHNKVSHQRANQSKELLVYYVSDRHPECSWAPAQDASHVRFSCTWFGSYPLPKLRWGNLDELQVTDSVSVTMNRSMLAEGQTLKCTAQHQLLGPETDKSCSFTFKLPYPNGEPLVTALEDSSVTLTCSESTSLPPANSTWRRGLLQDIIVPGTKYQLSSAGSELKLTILNVSKDDEGVYFCHSENPLAERELEVYLTVKKASSAYTGAIIGVFIAALIVGSTIIVAKTLYTSRHRICLGDGFGQVDEDRGDVLSLVESDDEQIFQNTVPRLPPITNGNHTTLVQIHPIPSSDREDAEDVDSSPQPHEDNVQTEQSEDLVTF